jgi:hypothetical protein
VKTIIAGSRGILDTELVWRYIRQAPFVEEITEVVSGHAMGVDLIGEVWAGDNMIPCTIFRADWDKFGKKAGILRNLEMADYADALIYVWDGKSKGTKHMIDEMRKRNKPVWGVTPSAVFDR